MSTPLPFVAASYARSATDDTEKISHQHAILADRAAGDGFSILDRHRFDDVMGSGATLRGPGFSSMIAAACRGEFSRLYVTEPTRLSRGDPRFCWHVRSLLSMLGVELIFADHAIDEVAQ